MTCGAGCWLWADAQPPVLQDHLRLLSAWGIPLGPGCCGIPTCGSCLPRGMASGSGCCGVTGFKAEATGTQTLSREVS